MKRLTVETKLGVVKLRVLRMGHSSLPQLGVCMGAGNDLFVATEFMQLQLTGVEKRNYNNKKKSMLLGRRLTSSELCAYVSGVWCRRFVSFSGKFLLSGRMIVFTERVIGGVLAVSSSELWVL